MLNPLYALIRHVPADLRIEANDSGSDGSAQTTAGPPAQAPSEGSDTSEESEAPKAEAPEAEEPGTVREQSISESTPEEPGTAEQPTKPIQSSVLAEWLAFKWPSGARRMLMNIGFLKQSDDPLTDISGAGNMMACNDHKVTKVPLPVHYPVHMHLSYYTFLVTATALYSLHMHGGAA